MVTIKESLTFDDVLLLPKYSNVLPANTNILLQLTKKISLRVPFLSSAMDTVTESKMAIAIAREGGMGIIHRNLNTRNQSEEVLKVKKKNLYVGAAIGTNKEDLDRARSLASSGVDLIHNFFNIERKTKNNILSKSVQFIGNNSSINKVFTKIANKGILF